jgi:hypothetical protein
MISGSSGSEIIIFTAYLKRSGEKATLNIRIRSLLPTV